MKKLALAACLIALAGCNSPSQTAAVVGTAATVSAAVLPPATLATIQKTCAAASAPLAAVSVANPKVASVAVYPVAYCQQLAAAPAGQVPATTNANTAAWLQTAIQLAGIVLPLVL